MERVAEDLILKHQPDVETQELMTKFQEQQLADVQKAHTLKDVLRAEVTQWQMAHQSDEQAAKDKVPRLDSLAGANILEKHVKTCLFSADENTRLAVYEPDKGIYTQNYDEIKWLIALMYPPFNEHEAMDVIYHMKQDAPIRSLTIDRYLIPVNNGIWNLHQHRLMPFSPDYVFTTKIATNYVENPVPPNIDGWTFDGWLSELACDDPEIVNLLWQVINDSVNGNFTRRKAIFLYSQHGSSGKGTFQSLIENLVGSNNRGSLKINQFDERFKLANLMGKTVCIGDDIPPDIYIKDGSNFNSVVTGDTVTIEFKGRDVFTTNLRCTVIQSCNGMPNFHNKTGTMRRLVIVPFNNHFEGKTDNWLIKDNYLHQSDVLEYALYQALNMDFERFTIPDASVKAMREYESESNPLIDFKETFFDQLPIKKIPTYYLYGYYKQYCHNNNFQSLSQIKFIRRFTPLVPEYEKKSARLSQVEIYQLDEMIRGQDEVTLFNVRKPLTKTSYKCLVRTI